MPYACMWLIVSHLYIEICNEKYRELLGNPKAPHHKCLVFTEGAKAETTWR